MMSVSFSALNAKVRYWMSNILKPEDVQNLLSMNAEDIKRAIMDREKKAVWKGEETALIEAGLLQAIPEYVKSAIRYVSGAERHFLKYWMRSFEIENLKTIARSLVSAKRLGFLYETHSRWMPSRDEIAVWRGFDEFKESLRHTDYYQLAGDSFPRVQEEQNSFYWEIGLDNLFARGLKRESVKLSGASRKQVESLLFYAMELSRLEWMKRLRFFYHMSVEELRSFVPNVLKALTEERNLRLLETDDESQRLKLLEGWKLLPEGKSEQNIELRMNAAIRKKCRQVFGGNAFSFGLLWGFLLLKSQDVRILTVILEGKRQGLSPAQISGMVGSLE